MKIFTDHRIKRLFGRMAAYLFVFIVLGAALIAFGVRDSALYLFGAALVMSVVIFLSCYGYFQKQNRCIEEAQEKITAYLSGDLSARIECDEEGELYKLFHKINSLAAVLNAHAEREQESRTFLKNTISDISHQLKTPLAALNIYNGIMQDEMTQLSDIREFTRLSEQELDRLEGLVQNLLKITKLDAGTIVLDRKLWKVSEMLEDVAGHFTFRAGQEGKRIETAGDDSIRLFCDRGWLTQALDNIVKNALEHTQEGGRISIQYREFMSVVQIVIQDDGSGIHREDLPHIFKRFYRSRFSKDTQGIGLGLPLAKAVIEAQDGSVEVDSEPGRGTTFTLNFLTGQPPFPTKL